MKMSTKRAKRRTLTWVRNGKSVGSRVPIGSPLHLIKTKTRAEKAWQRLSKMHEYIVMEFVDVSSGRVTWRAVIQSEFYKVRDSLPAGMRRNVVVFGATSEKDAIARGKQALGAHRPPTAKNPQVNEKWWLKHTVSERAKKIERAYSKQFGETPKWHTIEKWWLSLSAAERRRHLEGGETVEKTGASGEDTGYTIRYHDKILKRQRESGFYQHPPTQIAEDFAKNPNVENVEVVPTKRPEYMHDVAITQRDAVMKAKKIIDRKKEMLVTIICPDCNGRGTIEGKRCRFCKGTGLWTRDLITGVSR